MVQNVRWPSVADSTQAVPAASFSALVKIDAISPPFASHASTKVEKPSVEDCVMGTVKNYGRGKKGTREKRSGVKVPHHDETKRGKEQAFTHL